MPDPKGGGAAQDALGGPSALPPVGELSLVTAQVPRNTETPQYPSAIMGSTPGFALAGVRPPPGGPTLPELDALSLTNAISQMANAMFAAPPAASAPPANALPQHADTSAYSEPPAGAMAPSPGVAPAVTTPAGATPFDAPPNLAGIAMPMEQPGFSFPLHEGHAGHAPLAPANPAHPSRTAQPEHRYAFDTFEITPAQDPSVKSLGTRLFDPNVIKKEFPILSEPVRGKRLVWLDNAATTQKPKSVIDRLTYFYEHENSNIHRAAHTLAAKATDAYEAARETVRRFINAPSKNDVIFVRGTTEGINLLSQSYGRRHVREGDEIVITHLEHHANIVPWQMLCQEKGARLKVAPVDSKGAIILEEYEKLLSPRTRIVSITQVSNALGTITPAKDMIDMAHRHGAVAVLDGAQSVSHMPVDVQDLGADFFVFSGHKVFGPTGIGAVFGKQEILEHMPPWQGGGNMIEDVTFERTRYQGPPARFEAGTGNIADAVGLGAALDWVSRVGIHNIERYEHELLEYGTSALATVPGLTMIGRAPQKAGVLSFILDGQKTEEVGGLLDQEGIAVRSGHHCAQPILRRFGVEATVRASLAPYNTCEDIDALVAALHKLQSGRR
ncbi:MAG: family 2A encapsulin nanocompartment cargo protein cysteine desulfurase [Labilithrix sp.]